MSTVSFLSLFLGALIPPPSLPQHSLSQQPFLYEAKGPRRNVLRILASQNIIVLPGCPSVLKIDKNPHLSGNMVMEGQVSHETCNAEISNGSCHAEVEIEGNTSLGEMETRK